MAGRRYAGAAACPGSVAGLPRSVAVATVAALVAGKTAPVAAVVAAAAVASIHCSAADSAY